MRLTLPIPLPPGIGTDRGMNVLYVVDVCAGSNRSVSAAVMGDC
jgi:hypothetical protein